MSKLSSSDQKLLNQLVERHCAFARWFREASQAVQDLRREKFLPFRSVDLLPAFDPGELEKVNEFSFAIPISAREDKEAYCFAFLKLFVRCMEDRFAGEYALGRSLSDTGQNLLFARILRCNHLAMIQLSVTVDANLIYVAIRYAAFDTRLDEAGDYLIDWWHTYTVQTYPTTVHRTELRTQFWKDGAKLNRAALEQLVGPSSSPLPSGFEHQTEEVISLIGRNSGTTARELQSSRRYYGAWALIMAGLLTWRHLADGGIEVPAIFIFLLFILFYFVLAVRKVPDGFRLLSRYLQNPSPLLLRQTSHAELVKRFDDHRIFTQWLFDSVDQAMHGLEQFHLGDTSS